MDDKLNYFVAINYKCVFCGREIVWACEPVRNDVQKGG